MELLRAGIPGPSATGPRVAPGPVLGAIAILGSALLCGCSSVASSAASDFAGNLSSAILNQDDPDLVRDSLPAYLLVLDSLAAPPDASPAVLGAATKLYALYAVVFVHDPARAAGLADHARGYGRRALCASSTDACDLEAAPFGDFERRINDLDPDAADGLLDYAVGSLAFIRTHSDDWQALADLPKVEKVFERLVIIGKPDTAGTVNMYLGVLNTLRPPALGGNPERGKAYFEKALELTGGRDLSVQVEFARGYARLVYDRDLYDKLLREVIAANPRQPGLTLFNVLARQQARELLANADEYF